VAIVASITTRKMKQEYIRDNEGQNYNPQSFGIKFADLVLNELIITSRLSILSSRPGR